MTRARPPPINTRTTRGLAIVRDALDGRRNHDRTDTCLGHSETGQGSAWLNVPIGCRRGWPRAGRSGHQIASNGPFLSVMVTFDFARIRRSPRSTMA